MDSADADSGRRGRGCEAAGPEAEETLWEVFFFSFLRSRLSDGPCCCCLIFQLSLEVVFFLLIMKLRYQSAPTRALFMIARTLSKGGKSGQRKEGTRERDKEKKPTCCAPAMALAEELPPEAAAPPAPAAAAAAPPPCLSAADECCERERRAERRAWRRAIEKRERVKDGERAAIDRLSKKRKK